MICDLKLPIGIDDFQKLRENHFYYVDKTKLIEELIQNWGEVNLYTRPRRFGKTLNMSMLYHFFRIGADPSLFEGLYISKNKDICEKYMGKYPTIFISLKDVDGLTFEKAKYRLTEIIVKEARKFDFLLKSDILSSYDKDVYKAIVDRKDGKYSIDNESLSSVLNTLSQLLYTYYHKKVIVLIDEYDVPLDKAFQKGYYKEMVDLIRGLFSQVLKTNPYLYFAVLTGCLRVSKESIFTGLNNFKVLSITDERFDEEFGFTEKDVEILLGAYGLEDHVEETKRWYDGYRFGGVDIYCPWDVINHVDRIRVEPTAKPQAYWINSSGNALVKRFIEKADRTTRSEIERLIQGNTIQKTLNLELTYDELDGSINNLWSVLFTTGYLTMVGKPDFSVFTLIIPNEEVRQVFITQIREWFAQTIQNNTVGLQSFWTDLESGNAKAVEKSLNVNLSKTISLFDPKGPKSEKEKFYHAFLLGLLIGNSAWGIYSNKESGEGFADIMVETEDPEKGMVIELKSVDTLGDMETACQKAMTQIEDRRYDEFLRNEGYSDILAVGIAFYKKRCMVVAKNL